MYSRPCIQRSHTHDIKKALKSNLFLSLCIKICLSTQIPKQVEFNGERQDFHPNCRQNTQIIIMAYKYYCHSLMQAQYSDSNRANVSENVCWVTKKNLNRLQICVQFCCSRANHVVLLSPNIIKITKSWVSVHIRILYLAKPILLISFYYHFSLCTLEKHH